MRFPLVLMLGTGLMALALAVPPEANQPQPKKKTFDASALEAARRAQLPAGLTARVWAAEPDLANPVSFAFDGRGAAYVVETYRHTDGATDTRGHMYWLDDDLACRTVQDRLAMYKKHKYPAYEKFGEQLRKVWDSSGSGVADSSSVFAGPFNKPEDGVAAGVLVRDNRVYFACIPDLYQLQDTKNAHRADVVKSIHTGFGVHVQFIGHDLHGLIMGPDGKLYMSIGDRGFHIITKEGKVLHNPDSGAVLRCDLDGSNLEVVHIGLRNPQELAFDEYGNLFTWDNNSDSGDRARWIHIVEGGDSGWRCGYQYGTLMHHNNVPQQNRGPWNTEKIWHTATPDQPAYIVPPLKHFGNGPSGICYYPGVGLGKQYQGRFFATDFTASPVNSLIWSLRVQPKGASFEVSDPQPFIRNIVPTDCDFGPDGAFYWLDWTGGWDKPKKGRIFRVVDAEAMQNPAVAEAKALLAGGFSKLPSEQLIKLLAHPHMKIRQESQFELASRVTAAQDRLIAELTSLAKNSPSKHARLHAIWAIGQVGRRFPELPESLSELLADPDADLRVAAAKSLAFTKTARTKLVERLTQEADLRVQAELLRELAKLPVAADQLGSAALPAFNILKTNADRDPHLRQAAAEYLVGLGAKPCDLIAAHQAAGENFNTPSVRLGLVLALRKLNCPKLGEFLADPEPRVATEAARAIYDQDLQPAMEALAKRAELTGQPEALVYRALAANFRLGDAAALSRLVNYAGNSAEPAHLRETALKLLGDWPKPGRRDPVTGLTMSLPNRDKAPVVQAIKTSLPKLLNGPASVRNEAVKEIAKLGITGVGPELAKLVRDPSQSAQARAEALAAMEAIQAQELAATANEALNSDQLKLKAAARAILAKRDPKADESIPRLLRDSATSLLEKQALLGILPSLKTSQVVDELLVQLLDELMQGQLAPELHLDVLEAARDRAGSKGLKLQAPLREKLAAFDSAGRAKVGQDPLARHRETLYGGDPELGRNIVLNNAAVYCTRCHKLDGQGGEVGPALNGLASKPTHTREYFLESIVYPNAKIAEGYQSVILNLADGRTVSGVLREKTAKQYVLVTADNKVLTIPKDEIEGEKPDQSAMPDDLHKKLSKRELRDVVAFLASLK